MLKSVSWLGMLCILAGCVTDIPREHFYSIREPVEILVCNDAAFRAYCKDFGVDPWCVEGFTDTNCVRLIILRESVVEKEITLHELRHLPENDGNWHK